MCICLIKLVFKLLFGLLSGYNWRTPQLDPSTMNIKGANGLLPHLVQVLIIFLHICSFSMYLCVCHVS